MGETVCSRSSAWIEHLPSKQGVTGSNPVGSVKDLNYINGQYKKLKYIVLYVCAMRYEDAPDLQERMSDIACTLRMGHIDLTRVRCLRGFGSSSRRTIARCHALGKVMQKAMNVHAFYTIEFLERFDRLSAKEQDKVIIHELMHIPKSFGGGFRQHDFVCDRNVEILHERYMNLKHDLSEKDLISILNCYGDEKEG